MSDGGLASAARLVRIAELESAIGALQAEQLVLLATVDSDPVTTSLPGIEDKHWAVEDKHWAVEDVAVTLRLSPAAARARLAGAVEAMRVPRLLDLLAHGAVTLAHVRAATDQTITLTDTEVAAIEQRVIDRAGEQSVGTFRSAVRRAVLAVTAPSIEQRRQANLTERRVCLRTAGEGTSELWALLPDEGAAALMSAITALGDRRGAADQRTADQRRADALVQLGLDSLAGQISTVLPQQQRLRPAMQVTVALTTLLQLDDQPGELAGIGPISAALARRLADDPSGTWRRLITDPAGHLIDCGRQVYRPPAALARHVIARDRTCRFPHCTRTAARSEIDHTVAWQDGGTTDAANLTVLCPRHHRLRHNTRWQYRRGADGTTSWTSPAGQRHDASPATYPTDPDPPPF